MLAAVAFAGAPAEPKAPAATPKIDFNREIAPLIKKYCFECHTGDEPEGEFSLWFETEADFLRRVSSEREHFKKMMDALRNYDMPPSDVAQPSDPERDRLVAWVGQNVLRTERPRPVPPAATSAAHTPSPKIAGRP